MTSVLLFLCNHISGGTVFSKILRLIISDNLSDLIYFITETKKILILII